MRIAPSSVLPHGLYSCDIFVVQDRCHLFRCSEIFRHKAGKTHSHGWVATIDRPYSVSIRYVYIYPIYFGTLEQFGLEPLWLLGFRLFQSCSDPYQYLGVVPKLGLRDPVGPRTCPGDCFCFCNNLFVAVALGDRFRPSVPKFGTRIGTDFYARWNTGLRKSRPVFMTLVSSRSA